MIQRQNSTLLFFIKSREVKTSFLEDLCTREISATIGSNIAVLSKAMLSVAQGSRRQMTAESGIVVYRGLDFSKAKRSNNIVLGKCSWYLILAYFESINERLKGKGTNESMPDHITVGVVAVVVFACILSFSLILVWFWTSEVNFFLHTAVEYLNI